MERLGSYDLERPLTSRNSGYSLWSFGEKHDREYFIKQFLSPKYPADDSASSPERIARVMARCTRFEQRKAALYHQLNTYSNGVAVRVEEFFRVDSKYYISMRKIHAISLDIASIAARPQEEQRFICAVIAYGVAGLHQGGIVHGDLKHDNILFMRSNGGYIAPKIIDFDSGFLETDPPEDEEELVGDQVYFSPEACMTFMGEKPRLTCKMDIFALGVLFHQYFTGCVPDFDSSLGHYAGEAVACGGTARAFAHLPEDIRQLLTSMLDVDPDRRPTALEVHAVLCKKTLETVPVENPATVAPSTQKANPFFRAGDL